MGAGEIAPVSNARVATAPFRRASMVSAPLLALTRLPTCACAIPAMPSIGETMRVKLREMEARLKLLESEMRGQVDLSQFKPEMFKDLPRDE